MKPDKNKRYLSRYKANHTTLDKDDLRGAWFEQHWLESTGAWDILDERERDEYRSVCGARSGWDER